MTPALTAQGMELLLQFAFYYPLFMSYVWMIGGVYYFFHWERKGAKSHDQPPRLNEYPPVSFIVPCHNEGENIRETIAWVATQDYPDFEIIAVNDGSTDTTGEILDELAAALPRLRVIHFAENQGKAVGLRTAALAARHEYLVCIDGDALLDTHAATWLIRHFINGPRVAAVTGNPRIRTRSTLLGKIQVGEFSSIIGMIKRAQRIYGRVFTVSGVVSAFRKTALHDVGYWSLDMVTEDIDISWQLQTRHWDIRYEPNALCWILMPETLGGLWRQRLRWAQGGAEVLLKYWRGLFAWKKRRMWGVFSEYFLSIAWSYTMAALFTLWLLGLFFQVPAPFAVHTILPEWHGVILGITCLLQFAVSLMVDSRYERGLGRYYYWMIWYPLAFWMINMATAVVAFPKALLKRRGKRARWTSPDRGIRP